MGQRSNYSKKYKMKTWIVTRLVKEKYQVDGFSREDAKSNLGEKGDPVSIEIISETVKQINP
jgi:hypothetical protein